MPMPNLTLEEALTVLLKYNEASMHIQPGDRAMLAQAEHIVSEKAFEIRERFYRAF